MVYDTFPLISVIIPIYKVEDYVRPCVRSVLNQSYTNLEVILVDDGSPDNCGAICDEFAALDERVVVMHKPNGGLSDARNAGLDIAQGELVAFLDGDDLAHRDWLLTLYQSLKEHNAEVAFCDYQIVRENDFDVNKESQASRTELLEGLAMLYTLYEPNWVPKNIVVWNKLYKREIFENLRFPVGKVHEDEFIYLSLYAEPRRIVYTDFVGIGYMIRSNSITRSRYSIDKWYCHKEYGLERKEYFIKHGMIDLLRQHRSQENKLFAEFLIVGRIRPAYKEFLSVRFFEIWKDSSVSIKTKLAVSKAMLLLGLGLRKFNE